MFQPDLGSSSYQVRLRPLKFLIPLTLLLAVIVGCIAMLPHMLSHADADPNAGAAVNMSCTLVVPAAPLTAQGLATPYQLTATDPGNGPCNEANANQSAFVQGVIYDSATGKVSVYSPLVIDKGTQPAVAPVFPTLPPGAVVGLWFGFNGTNLTLQEAQPGTLAQSGCVNGLNQSVFGQFAYCNAPMFFASVTNGIAAGLVQVPALGVARDTLACPTSRDFGIVDQDQSDNVQTQYLATADGRIAQFSTANQAQTQNTTLVANPSDNALLTTFIDPALGCQPWTAPDLANNNNPVSALALDEIQAAAYQQAPIALVPLNDPMTMVNTNQSLAKTNVYRIGVDQPVAMDQIQADGKTYCQSLVQTGLPRLMLDKQFTIAAPSPNKAMANSLFTFLAQRFMMSYTNLGCQQLLGLPNPVQVQTNAGMAVAATINQQSGQGANGNNAMQQQNGNHHSPRGSSQTSNGQ